MWEEQPEIKNWLGNKKPRTKKAYLQAMTAFIEFSKLTPKALIDEAETDLKKPRRERGAPKRRAEAFYNYLLTDYELNKPTNGRKRTGVKGASKNTASTFLGAVKSFYKANNFELNYRVPKATRKKENIKRTIYPEDVQKLLNVADSLRDKAFILTQYESLQSIQEVVNLNYGDISRELEKGEIPLHIHMIREKADTEYDTFIGEDAIALLKAYIEDRKRKGETMKIDTPLFINEGVQKYDTKGKPRRVTTTNLSTIVRKCGLLAGLVTEEELEKADMSPVRSHTLRASASTILQLAGVPKPLVDYWTGHAVSETDRAYFVPPVEKQREIYEENYHRLSISAAKVDTVKIKELEKKTKAYEIDSKEKGKDIRILLDNTRLLIENGQKITRRLDKVERYITNLENMYKEQLSPEQEALLTELATNIEALPREERIEQLRALLFAWSRAFNVEDVKPYIREKIAEEVKAYLALKPLR